MEVIKSALYLYPDMSKLSSKLAQESKGYAKKTDSLLRQVRIVCIQLQLNCLLSIMC